MKLIKYFFVGLAAALLDLSVFALFAHYLQFNYLWVGAAGFVLATLLNYILSIRYVFASGVRFNNKRKELMVVYFMSGIGLLVHQISLYLTVDRLLLPLMLAKISAIGVVFFWNFAIRHFFVFAPPKKRN